MNIDHIKISQEITLSFVGPPLSAGPLPAVFYFALSANESLTLDPYNQPVAFLSHYPMRIFSLTLPGHDKGLHYNEALQTWAEEFSKGNDPLTPFIDQICIAVQELLKQNLVLPDKMAVAGLSRGGFIAVHAAARIPAFQTIVGFAPLTQLRFSKDFLSLQDHTLTDALNLSLLSEKISDRSFRFYIGNRDERVGTARCFEFVQSLTESAYKKGIRSPEVELFITPSIGFQGHGTHTSSFHDGAKWIVHQLGINHVSA